MPLSLMSNSSAQEAVRRVNSTQCKAVLVGGDIAVSTLCDEEPASSQTLTATDGLTAIWLSCAPGLAFSRIQSSPATLDTSVSQLDVEFVCFLAI